MKAKVAEATLIRLEEKVGLLTEKAWELKGAPGGGVLATFSPKDIDVTISPDDEVWHFEIRKDGLTVISFNSILGTSTDDGRVMVRLLSKMKQALSVYEKRQERKEFNELFDQVTKELGI